MNMSYGVQKYKIRSIYIKQIDGIIGPYHDPTNPNMISVGETQSLVFFPN